MMQILNIQKIGENTINTALRFLGPFGLLYSSLKNIRSLKIIPVRTVLYKQIYFTGIEALRPITIIGGLIGIVIITQVANIVGLNSGLTGKILIWTVVRELGPLLTAIIIIARSCTAMAAEIGSMKVNGEIDSLRLMGISPLDYIVIPRILGATASVFILTFYFQVVAIAGGLLVSSVFIKTPFFQHAKGIFSSLSPFEIGVSLVKGIVFGLVISAVSCFRGFMVKSSITEVPQATTVAVMQSLFLVFIFDGLITLVSFI